jgi:myosin-5
MILTTVSTDDELRWTETPIEGGSDGRLLPSQYRYLDQSDCFTVEGRDDDAMLSDLCCHLETIGITPIARNAMFRSLLGVLELGNLSFEDSPTVDGGSAIVNYSSIEMAAKLLGIDGISLACSLCYKTVEFNGEMMDIPLAPTKAAEQRDALAKYLYGRIFDVLVGCINMSLQGHDVADSRKTLKWIGILDIFGFEVFKVSK